MPSVLIICAHRRGRSPSQRYRFEQYLSFLETQGYRFTFSSLLNKHDDTLFYSKGNFFRKIFILVKSVLIRLNDLMRINRFDIVFIQREASFLGTAFFEKRASRSRAKVIFDFDDSIWLADTSPGNQKWEWIKKPRKFFTNIKAADLIIAGNSYLADKARSYNNQVTVIPTTINTDEHIPKPELRNKKTLTIGWSGSISTVKHFELLTPVLLRIKKKYGDRVQFSVIGDAGYRHKQLAIKGTAWSEKTEVDLINSFDIGLMPLPDDAWANGKCGLKGLSYMACGIPTVMSAVGVNKNIITQGENGFLAETENEWFTTLSNLIDSEELRRETGKKGRNTVVADYSVAANRNKYLQVFEKLRPVHKT